MTPARPDPAAGRLISLDAFRGLTIAGMIVVNNPGTWSHLYSPLGHATWHGWTPTDLVFPFFLFIVGVAIPLALGRRLASGAVTRLSLLPQVIRRSVIIFLLGLLMAGFPDFRLIGPYVTAIVGLTLLFWDEPGLSFALRGAAAARKWTGLVLCVAAVAYFALDYAYFEASHIRVPGVLQRIGVCYLLASVLALWGGMVGCTIALAAVLLGYWWILACVSPPADFVTEVTGVEGRLHDWIDRLVLGSHLYRERPDPEGVLSTLPALGTALLGVLTGYWLRTARDARDKCLGLFIAGSVLLVVGLFWSLELPINKKIWTSSYVLVTAGVGLQVLGVCFWLIDLQGWRRWAWPLLVFGSNAITVYVASSLTAKMLGIWKWSLEGKAVSVKTWFFEHLQAGMQEALPAVLATPKNASLLYALLYVSVWLLPMALMYWRRILIRI